MDSEGGEEERLPWKPFSSPAGGFLTPLPLPVRVAQHGARIASFS